MNRLRLLSSEDVDRTLTMSDAIASMRGAFADLSSGKAVVPQRTRLEMEGGKSRSLIMPVYSSESGRYGAKIVVLSDKNPAGNLPFIHGIMLVFDARTGVPLGMMNAERMTALRTGAASGLATDLLSKKESRTAVIIGAGTQARTQAEGVASVRNLSRIFVYSLNKHDSERCASDLRRKLQIDVEVAESHTIVREADIVCTATTSAEPVFHAEDVRDGTHINAIGSYQPETTEIPPETIRRGVVVVDSCESCLSEAGDLLIPINQGIIQREHIRAELGEIVLGKHPGRSSPDDITIFKSVGNAVQDLAVAMKALSIAEERNIGTVVSM